MKGLGIVAAVVLLPVLLAVALFAFSGDRGVALLPEAERKAALAIQSDDYVAGNPDSSVVLVEYLDYQCPACAAYHPVVNQLVEEYGDRVAFVTRHFPLAFHANARPAAYAVEAAGRQDRRAEFSDLIFENQAVWSARPFSEDTFDSYAQELGLDMDRFIVDRSDQVIVDKVQSQYETGLAVGVNSTPSFFLDGERLDNPANIEEARAILDRTLAESGQDNSPSTDEESVSEVKASSTESDLDSASTTEETN